jgi:CheY-like chemotaxis protein
MRILIVDDDPDIRIMMRALFRAQGWNAEEVASGQEALTRLDSTSEFDAVVLDYKMPRLTGLELARNLHHEGLGPSIIICSAYLNPQIREEAATLGVPTIDKTDLRLLVEMIRERSVA